MEKEALPRLSDDTGKGGRRDGTRQRQEPRPTPNRKLPITTNIMSIKETLN